MAGLKKQLKDLKTIENSIDGNEYVFVSQNGNTRKTTINDVKNFTIGTEDMGTTATTIKGAIKEHEKGITNITTEITNIKTGAVSVKMADKAKEIDVTGQLNGCAQYYGVGNGGTINDTKLKLRPFPVGTITDRIDTFEFTMLTKDIPQSIPFVSELSELNCFVQVFKKDADELNVTETFEDYNNELVTNHSEGVNCDVVNGLSINDTYEYNSELKSDGIYETTIINNDFIEILSIKVIK